MMITIIPGLYHGKVRVVGEQNGNEINGDFRKLKKIYMYFFFFFFFFGTYRFTGKITTDRVPLKFVGNE